MNDPCERSAEYIDNVIADGWYAFGPALAETLGVSKPLRGRSSIGPRPAGDDESALDRSSGALLDHLSPTTPPALLAAPPEPDPSAAMLGHCG